MKHLQRQRIRLAMAICEDNQQSYSPEQIRLPADYWQEALRLTRKIEAARRRGWIAAAGRLTQELQAALADVESALANLRLSLAVQPHQSQFPSPKEIVADLLALEDEFSEVGWDLKSKRLTAVTTPISFDDVQLGRFAIELHWEGLCPPLVGCYRIIAKEPNPASSEEDVTHPHVQGELLCEGQATVSIRRALSQGRLMDFFLLVRSVLETYNAGGPYVPIEQWEGIRCDECDASVRPADLSFCPNCDRRLCEDCYASCPSCDSACCYECRGDCADCDQTFCVHCLTPCPRCGRQVCPHCRDDQQQCEKCHDLDQTEDSRADAALQPHGLGEAALSA